MATLYKLFDGFIDFLILIRFATSGITVVMPLLGAFGVSQHLSLAQMIGIICISICWHIFAHVSNDVADLELDRNQPDRSDSPLVTGRVKPWQALTLAFAQLPITFLIVMWMSNSAIAYTFWLTTFVFMGIYNIWGKRLRYSLLTDFIQGCSWASLALLGSAVVAPSPNLLNVGLFAYLVGFILMASGIHGTVRDLPNDMQQKKQTTAMLFGARSNEVGGITLTLALKVYGATVQAWLHLCVLIPLVANWFHYDNVEWFVTLGMEILLVGSAWYLLAQVPHVVNNFQKLYQVGLYHLLATYLSLIILYTFHVGIPILFLMLAIIILPLFTIRPREKFKIPQPLGNA